MRKGLIAVALVGSLAAVSTAALADDTTTTTTTTTTNQQAPGVTVGVPGVVGVTIGGGTTEGCTTHNTTHTNDETGTTVSRTATNCN